MKSIKSHKLKPTCSCRKWRKVSFAVLIAFLFLLFGLAVDVRLDKPKSFSVGKFVTTTARAVGLHMWYQLEKDRGCGCECHGSKLIWSLGWHHFFTSPSLFSLCGCRVKQSPDEASARVGISVAVQELQSFVRVLSPISSDSSRLIQYPTPRCLNTTTSGLLNLPALRRWCPHHWLAEAPLLVNPLACMPHSSDPWSANPPPGWPCLHLLSAKASYGWTSSCQQRCARSFWRTRFAFATRVTPPLCTNVFRSASCVWLSVRNLLQTQNILQWSDKCFVCFTYSALLGHMLAPSFCVCCVFQRGLEALQQTDSDRRENMTALFVTDSWQTKHPVKTCKLSAVTPQKNVWKRKKYECQTRREALGSAGLKTHGSPRQTECHAMSGQQTRSMFEGAHTKHKFLLHHTGPQWWMKFLSVSLCLSLSLSLSLSHTHKHTHKTLERWNLQSRAKLTREEVRQQRDGQYEEGNCDVGHRQVGKEKVGDVPHLGVPADDRDDEAVVDDGQHEHDQVGEAEHERHGQRDAQQRRQTQRAHVAVRRVGVRPARRVVPTIQTCAVHVASGSSSVHAGFFPKKLNLYEVGCWNIFVRRCSCDFPQTIQFETVLVRKWEKCWNSVSRLGRLQRTGK